MKNCDSGPSTGSGRVGLFGGAALFLWEFGRGAESKLVLVAGEKPQLRKASARDWSKAKAASFLGALAETCNVTEACRRSGVPMTVAYRRRKSDAAFRTGWLEAIGAAYRRLELVLLDRAFNGTEKVKRHDGSEERMLEYSNQLGRRL